MDRSSKEFQENVCFGKASQALFFSYAMGEGVVDVLLFTYLFIGVFFCFFKKEPVLKDKQEQAVYMFYLLGWIVLWPVFLIRRLIRGI
ncbi:hypothetical protein [Halobacillus litoralis]|nr:hypothetical protein [Halobacillus litoralis]